MLVLSRKIDESFTVDGPAKIFVLDVARGRVKIGIEAEKSVTILRTELAGTGAAADGKSSA